MKVFGLNTRWEPRLLAGVVAVAVFGGTTSAWSDLILKSTNSTAQAATAYLWTPGLADVLKMANAKVDPEVIKAYIKASSVPYNPSAAEVIALKNQGVSADVITALLQRGAELRTQVAQAPGQAPTQTPYPGYPGTAAVMPSPYDYGADVAPYDADYGYGYPPYTYGYPYNYWWYNSFWPYYSAWWPGFGFGFFNHHHHGDFHHGDFHHVNHFGQPRFQNDDFNRFQSPRFQNFDFNRNSSARFQNFDFNRTRGPWSPAFAFNRFNRVGVHGTPQPGVTTLGVPSQANGAAAFAVGPAPAAFAGRSGGSAGTITPPGGLFAPRTGPSFAVRGGGMGMRNGMATGMRGGMGGGARGGGGGGHR